MGCGLAMTLETKALMLLLRPRSEVDSISAQVLGDLAEGNVSRRIKGR